MSFLFVSKQRKTGSNAARVSSLIFEGKQKSSLPNSSKNSLSFNGNNVKGNID